MLHSSSKTSVTISFNLSIGQEAFPYLFCRIAVDIPLPNISAFVTAQHPRHDFTLQRKKVFKLGEHNYKFPLIWILYVFLPFSYEYRLQISV